MRFSVLFSTTSDSENQNAAYELLLDVAKLIDDSELAAVTIPERQVTAEGTFYTNPAVLATVLATHTSRVRIRGRLAGLSRDPIDISQDWSMVDNLSGGRVELVFSGTDDPDGAASSGSALTNWRVDSVRRLWQGDRSAAPGGTPAAPRPALLPRPVQPELPVWLATNSGPDFTRAAKAGQFVLTTTSAASLPALAANCARYRRATPWPHPADRSGVALVLPTFIGPDNDTAQRIAREPLRRFLRLHQAEIPEQGGEDRFLDEILGRTSLIGDIRTVSERLDQFAAHGVGEIACLVDFGVDPEYVEQGVLRLCEVADHAGLAARVSERP